MADNTAVTILVFDATVAQVRLGLAGFSVEPRAIAAARLPQPLTPRRPVQSPPRASHWLSPATPGGRDPRSRRNQVATTARDRPMHGLRRSERELAPPSRP